MLDISHAPAATPAITVHNLPALHGTAAEPLVLLHGWGCDSRSWQPLLERLNASFDLVAVELPSFADSTPLPLDQWVEELLAALPERAIYLGWSLGGMLATHIAAVYPQRVSALITLASNLRFAESEQWPMAMPINTFSQFCDAYSANSVTTLKRFAGLMAAGDPNERQLLKQLREQCSSSLEEANAQPIDWLEGLKLLGELDNTQKFAQIAQPGLHLFAVEDALVPATVCEIVTELNAQQRCELVSDACHALHWSQPAIVAEKILNFLGRRSVSTPVDKRRVAESFSRAANSYDSVAYLQREIGEYLLAGLAKSAGVDALLNERCLIDLGSGTGYFTPYLKPLSEYQVSLDLAEGMLQFASRQCPDTSSGVCGDAEQLPFADQSFDLLFSSLTIQWCTDLTQLFTELKRVMKPGASLSIATLGPDTLCELRDAWSQVDRYTHVNSFASRTQLVAAIKNTGLQIEGFEEQTKVLRFKQVRDLTYELKTLGAHNMNQGQSAGLTGRQRIKAFRQAYETHRQSDGLLPATYEVYYITLTA